MHYYFRTLCLLAVISFASRAAPYGDQGRGQVTMNGQIQVSACSLHTDDVWQEINFDTHSQRTLLNNTASLDKAFTLRLVNCRLEKEKGGEWNSLVVTFDGEPEPGNASLFTVAGDARGLALKITDIQGQMAIPGLPMETISLNEEGHQLDYRLQVVPTGSDIEEGVWSGSIRFMVSYQ